MGNSVRDERDLISELLEGKEPSGSTLSLLAERGVEDPRQAYRILEGIAQLLSPSADPGGLLQSITDTFAASFQPDVGLRNLERHCRALGSEGAREFVGEFPLFGQAVAAIFSASQYLTDIAMCRPQQFLEDLRGGALERAVSRQELYDRLAAILRVEEHFEARLERVREFKRWEYLRIAHRDLRRLDEPHVILAELSRVADVCLDKALELCEEVVIDKHGALGGGPDGRSRFAVIGMGKLGGEELNFSSDIDLMYLYPSDDGSTSGVPVAGGGVLNVLSAHEFHTKLARVLTEAVNRVTPHGSMFRVDLRLRPEGRDGDICCSLRSYELYYESWGETWERQALIKARPVAGDPALGEEFLRMVQPFVYPKYLDEAVLEEIGAIKDRVDKELERRGRGESNVKLGWGGIREVEFVVQAFQLLHGGRDEALRERNSLRALERLAGQRYLGEEEAQDLVDAYIFLRELENRIQIAHGAQTHLIPPSRRERAMLAREMGFTGVSQASLAEQLMAAYGRHTADVRRVYDKFFARESAKSAGALRAPVIELEDEDRNYLLGQMRQYGFTEPLRVLETLKLLRDGPHFFHSSKRSRRSFDALLPAILGGAARSPDPEGAIRNLEKFVSSHGGREALFDLFIEQPRLLDTLLSLFAHSEFLSDILVRDPKQFDTIVNPLAMTRSKSDALLAGEIDAALQSYSTPEEVMDEMRRVKIAEELRIGLRDILAEADLLETMRDLSTLADVYLATALRLAEQQLQARYGTPSLRRADGGEEACGVAVVGLGKYGGRELSYGSDLDLIFIYEAEGHTTGAAGDRGRISNYLYFARLYERFYRAVSRLTQAGFAYRIDPRLRPEGKQGPLALSVQRYRRYFQERAETWERQAFIKARVVAGDADLGERFMGIVHDFVYGRGWAPTIVDEVDHIRRRMEVELAREYADQRNVKLGYGGIVDIEFLTQLLQLRHAGAHPELRAPHTLQALEALAAGGWLDESNYEELRECYFFLRRLENRIRIVHQVPANILPSSHRELSALAKRLGYISTPGMSPGQMLLDDYRVRTRRVREIYKEGLALAKGSPTA